MDFFLFYYLPSHYEGSISAKVICLLYVGGCVTMAHKPFTKVFCNRPPVLQTSKLKSYWNFFKWGQNRSNRCIPFRCRTALCLDFRCYFDSNFGVATIEIYFFHLNNDHPNEIFKSIIPQCDFEYPETRVEFAYCLHRLENVFSVRLSIRSPRRRIPIRKEHGPTENVL